jgi:hypothetical protein
MPRMWYAGTDEQLEDARAKERQAFEAQGLINSGKTELGDAVDMRGTCETMCSPFEMETRNIRMEVHPFERVCRLQDRYHETRD